MSFLHGKGSQALLDGIDISAWLNSMDIGADVDTAETTTFQKDWKTYQAGLAGGSVDAGGFHDVDLTAVKDTLQASDGLLTFCPGKYATLGDPARLLALVSTSLKESSPVGDMVAFSWSGQGDDVVAFGRLFHPLAAATTTGTSASVDMGTAADGGVAHLHLTALAGTSPSVTVEFSDCATAGGTYTAVTGGAFTLSNAIGAKRLVITGTIRRYVKCTWTIAGTGGPSVTFAVALARA